jgi:hypothetical protein
MAIIRNRPAPRHINKLARAWQVSSAAQSAAEFAALSGKRRDTLKAIVHARQAKAAVELAWRTAIADAQLSLEE